MSRTDTDVTRTVINQPTGSHVVEIAPRSFNSNGSVNASVWKIVTDSFAPNTITLSQTKRVGSVTPGFNSPLRPRILPPLAFYFKQETWGPAPYSVREYRPSINGDTPINSITFSPHARVLSLQYFGENSASFKAAQRAQCIVKLRNKLKDQSINAAQAVAERKQTAQTVISAATSIAKAYSSVRKGDLTGAAKALGVKVSKRAKRRNAINPDQSSAASNAWLGLNYGWMPLLNDVYGAAEALAKSHDNRVIRKASQSTVRSWQKEENLVFPEGLSSASVGKRTETYSVNSKWSYRVTVYYSISSPPTATLAQLGITNPALLAWELLPLSFVVDWFLPIGNWLSSLDATLGLTFLNGHSTEVTNYNSTYNLYSYTTRKSTPEWWFSTFGDGSYQKVEVSRSVLGDFPASPPLPSFKNPLSTSHITSAMALLRQSFKR